LDYRKRTLGRHVKRPAAAAAAAAASAATVAAAATTTATAAAAAATTIATAQEPTRTRAIATLSINRIQPTTDLHCPVQIMQLPHGATTVVERRRAATVTIADTTTAPTAQESDKLV
jgi:glucose/arabinose dehydrogenase